MKTIRILLLTALLAFTFVVAAQAATSVGQGQMTKVYVKLKNVTYKDQTGTLILEGKNQAGAVIGKFAKAVTIRRGSSTYVAFDWQAPKYATTVKWTATVANGVVGEVPPPADSTVNDDHDEHDDDERDHDDSHHNDDDHTGSDD